MEKMNNMQQNKLNDEELDQITGGRNFMDLFTAEFRGAAKDPVTLEMPMDQKGSIKATTLEMRSNPLETQDSRKTKRIVKL